MESYRPCCEAPPKGEVETRGNPAVSQMMFLRRLEPAPAIAILVQFKGGKIQAFSLRSNTIELLPGKGSAMAVEGVPDRRAVEAWAVQFDKAIIGESHQRRGLGEPPSVLVQELVQVETRRYPPAV
jgi:hypothetical protein